MITSAGIAIILNNKILMGHPSKNPWFGSYSIPKGHVEPGENILDAAIRETREEIGIKIKKSQITDGPFHLDYITSKLGKKELYLYIVDIKDVNEIGIKSEVLDKKLFKPNKDGILEMDWAGFITFDEARKRASKPMQNVLDIIESIYIKTESFVFKKYNDFNGI